MKVHSKVTLVSDIDQVLQAMVPQPMWMIRPSQNRKYPSQRIRMTAEIVDLNTVNLARMRTFEVL